MTDRREYAREYRKKNKEKIAAADKLRRAKEYIRRRLFRNHGHIPKCQFCGILLTSSLVKKKHWKYCDSCKKDPEVKRHLRALYMSRWYNKKKGNQQPSLSHAEDIIS